MHPNIIKKKRKSTNTSKRVGKEFRREEISFLMPGIEFTVLRGLRILITLIADTLVSPKNLLPHPTVTTVKSS